MIRRTFRYCPTHKEDEHYMQQMCSQGWAAVSLVEGFWTFESCDSGQYCFRIAYLRGMDKKEVQQWIDKLAEKGIDFVSRYSFWAIFRSTEPFEIYTAEEERQICQKMAAPMLPGALISWILFMILIGLAVNVSRLFLIPVVLVGIYAMMCTWLGLSYRKLVKQK